MANNKAAIELRRNRTMQLLLDGTSYRKIAAVLGVSLGTVQNDIRRRLEAVRTEGEEIARAYRALQLERYESQLRTWMPRSRERKVEEQYEVEEPDPTDPAGQRMRKVWRTREIRIPPDPKATELVLRTLQAIDLLLGIRIPQSDEVVPPAPIDLSIQLIPTGVLEQLEDDHDDVTDVESEEVEDGRP